MNLVATFPDGKFATGKLDNQPVNFKFIFIFQKYFWNVKNLKLTKNKSIVKKIVNVYKDIVFMTRVRIFCTTLLTNTNIKIVIKSHTFLFHHLIAI